MGEAYNESWVHEPHHLKRLAVAAGIELRPGFFRAMRHEITREHDRIYPYGSGRDSREQALALAGVGEGLYLVERLEVEDLLADVRRIYWIVDGDEPEPLALVRYRYRRTAFVSEFEEIVILPPPVSAFASSVAPRSRPSALSS